MIRRASRRKTTKIIAVAAIATFAMTACRSGDLSSSDSGDDALSINSFGGTFQEAVEQTVVTPYEEETGRTVDVTTAIGSEALTQLRADPGAFDVAYMDLAVIEQAKAADLLQPIDLEAVPSSGELYPIAVDKDHYWVAELASMTGIAYNTEKVDDPPTSWRDLWDSKYQGKVAISNVSGTAGYQFLVQAARMNGGSESDIDPGFEAIADLKPNLAAIYNTPDEMSRLLTSGEAWVGPWYADRASAAKQSGAPIGFVEPKEGAIAVLSAMVIPKETGNVDAAEEWIEFQIAAENNSKFVQAIAEGPTNSTVELPQEFLDDNYVPYGEKQIGSLQNFDAKVISENLSDWVARWTTEIAN